MKKNTVIINQNKVEGYCTMFNTETEQLYKLSYGSGDVYDVPDNSMIKAINIKDHPESKKIHKQAKKVALKIAEALLLDSKEFFEGETVKVTNPNVKKHKDCQFVISGIETKWFRGIRSSEHLLDSGGNIRTNSKNVTKVATTKDMVNSVATRLLIGSELSL